MPKAKLALAGLSGDLETMMKRLALSHAAALTTALTTSLLLALPAAHAADDASAQKLARDGGCVTCRSVDHRDKGPNGLKPIGPAWRDVADRYRGQAGAADELTRIVRAGSNPYASHWKGKVSGIAMPPNAVVLNEAQTRELVGWILALKPQK